MSAQPLGQMIIELGLDSSSFASGMKGIDQQIKTSVVGMKAQLSIIGKSGDEFDKLKIKQAGLTSVIDGQNKKVQQAKKEFDAQKAAIDACAKASTEQKEALKRATDALGQAEKKLNTCKEAVEGNANATKEQKVALAEAKKEYKACEEEVTKNTVASQKQKDKLVKLNGEYVKAIGALGGYENQLNEVNIKLTAMESSVYKTGVALQSMGSKITSIGNITSKVGVGLTVGVTAPLLASGIAAIKAASDWESAFAGVKKTVDEVVDANGNIVYSYDQIEDSLIAMSQRIPATTTEIAAVAEAAGQLGIATESVADFTEVMINLGNTTNIEAETAASSLAKIINITGMAATDYERLGSSITALGNNMATTEADIVSMSTRMASAAKQSNMTETDILAISAALSSLGMQSQAGGSAISRILNDINSSVISGGEALEIYADVAGVSAEQFRKAWQDDAAGALVHLVAGLSDARVKGEDLVSTLSVMGIESTNDVNAMLALATSADTLSFALSTSRQAWEENTALANEANVRYATFESQMTLLQTKVGNVAIEVGGPLMEAMRSAISAADPLLETVVGLAQSFSNASPETQKMVIQLGLVAIAAGPVLTVTGKLTSGIGGLVTTIGSGMEQFSLWAAALTNTATVTAAKTAVTTTDTAVTVKNTVANAGNTTGLTAKTAKILLDTAATKAHAVVQKAHTLALMASNGMLITQAAELNAAIVAKIKDTVVTKTQTAIETARNIVTGITTGTITLQTLAAKAHAIATVAQTAAMGTCSVAAGTMGAAMTLALGPIGLIILGIAALVAGVVAAVKWFTRESDEAKRLKEETEKLSKANDALVESINSSNESYESSEKNIKSQTAAATELTDQVSQLAKVENKSIEQKRELKAYVGALNSSMEGLNISYNEQTDVLSMTTEEIYSNIAALDKQAQAAAAQERLVEIYGERMLVQEQLNQIQTKWNEAEANGNITANQRIHILRDLGEQEEMLTGQLMELESSCKYVTQIVVESTEVQAEAVEENTQTILEAYGSIGNAYDDLGKQQQQAIDGIVGSFETMTGRLSNLTEKIKLDSEATWKAIQENQEDTIAKTQEFSGLYAQLIEAGVSESYLKAIGATGPESIPLLKDMISQGTDVILSSQNEWQDAYGVVGDTLLDALELDDETKNALKDYVLGESGIYGTLQGAVALADLDALGKSLTDGISQGIIKSSDSLKGTMTDTANATTDAAEEAWDVNSPSKVFAGIGKFLMDGLVLGLGNGEGAVYAKANEIANNVTKTVKKALEIHSPSAVMRDQVGKNIALGIAEGITGNKDYAKKSAEEVASAIVQAAKQKLDNAQVYTELTLADEAAYWNTVRKQVKEGTQARIDADKQYFNAKKSLNQKMLTAENSYTSKVKKLHEDLEKSIQSLRDSYANELSSRTKDIASSMGLFEEFTAKTELSTSDLLNNLKSQVNGLQDWSSNLKALGRRGVSTGLMDELREMGTSAAGEVALLTQLTDAELNEYVALWSQKQRLAKKEARKELQPLLEETESQIAQMRVNAAHELSEYRQEFVATMTELGAQIQKPLDQIRESTLSAMQAVVQAAAGTVSSEADKQSNISKFGELAASVIQTATDLPKNFVEIGQNTVDGMIQGLQNKTSSLYDAMASVVRGAINIAKDEAQIHSPSRAMQSIGSYMTEGLGIGLTDMQSYAEGSANQVTKGVMDIFRNASVSMPTLTDRTGVIQSIDSALGALRTERTLEARVAERSYEAASVEQLIEMNQRMVRLLETIAGKDPVIDKSSITDVIDNTLGTRQVLKVREV